jgi:predicted nucleotidyltransferase
MNASIPIPLEQVAEFCKKWSVREFSIFGSALREDFGPKSDVDILVELEVNHTLSLFDWADMRVELVRIFERDVDLISKKGLKNPIRRREILRTARVLYAA